MSVDVCGIFIFDNWSSRNTSQGLGVYVKDLTEEAPGLSQGGEDKTSSRDFRINCSYSVAFKILQCPTSTYIYIVMCIYVRSCVYVYVHVYVHGLLEHLHKKPTYVLQVFRPCNPAGMAWNGHV